MAEPTQDRATTKREYMRRWRAANVEKRREHNRRYRERNRKVLAEKSRAYRQANLEAVDAKSRERKRRWREDNPERVSEYDRQWREDNLPKLREYGRKRYHSDRERALTVHAIWRHGPGIVTWVAETWEAQRGLCYLCENPMIREQANVDHDHRCCPAGKSCPYCRRGLACSRCNVLIGGAGDDPDLLEKIAGNLRSALVATRARMEAKPTQMELGS